MVHDLGPVAADARPDLSTGPPLFERAAELSVLDDSAGRLAGGAGGVVVIEAAAGLGKSVLLDHAAGRVAEAGGRVRHAAPGPGERQFPFGVVRALLEPPLCEAPLDERARLLRGAAGPAGELLSDGVAPDPGATVALAHSVLWLCSALAERRPLALVVDDAQWSDRASLEVLSYLARRAADLPLLILVAARGDHPGAPSDLLSLLGSVRGARVLWPRPLTPWGGVRLVRELAPDLPFAECHDLHRDACGNPWLLGELGRQAAAGAPGEPSAATRAVVLGRVAALAPRDRAVAAALSVLGDDASAERLVAVAGVAADALAPARDALGSAGLMTPDELRPAHPVIAAAIRGGLTCDEDQRLHAAAARALIADHTDAGVVAPYLLRSAPRGDAAISALLVQAAAAASARGEPRAAAACLKRAVAERAPGDDRGRMLADLATLVFDAGCPDARRTLRAALKEVADEEGRLDVLGRLAMLNVVDGHDAELLQLLADDLSAEAGSGLRLAYEAAALDAMIMVPGRHAERARRVTAVDLSAVDDPLLRRVVLGHRAWLAAERGEPDADRCAALALQALSGDLLLDESPRRAAYHLSVRALVLADRGEEAERAIDRLREHATARGSQRMRSAAAWYAAELAFRRGQVTEAESYARAALELVDDGPNVISGGATEVLVAALAERGAFAEAHELVPVSGGDAAWDVGLRQSAARLALAEGDFARAGALAREAGALRAAEGRVNPARTPWRSTAALALAHSGRRDEAVALAGEELALAERFGAPVPIATALHASAVAEPDLDQRVVLCERALALCSLTPTALVAARVRVTLGHALRTLGRRVEARDSLLPALADADAGGAALLARDAQRELVATGLRPRRAATTGAAALTPRQRQVCELAAQGKSNREIAHELFLSIKTVETHLALCFQKLGVAARGELGRALSA